MIRLEGYLIGAGALRKTNNPVGVELHEAWVVVYWPVAAIRDAKAAVAASEVCYGAKVGKTKPAVGSCS